MENIVVCSRARATGSGHWIARVAALLLTGCGATTTAAADLIDAGSGEDSLKHEESIGAGGQPVEAAAGDHAGGSLDLCGVTSAPPVPICPTSIPQLGMGCRRTPRAAFSCEYGDSPDMACNVYAFCGSHDMLDFACPTFLAILETDGGSYDLGHPPIGNCPAGTCPSGYASIASGGACDSAGLTCAYPEGTCICFAIRGPAGVRDGGDGGSESNWACSRAQGGCPSPRPKVGTPCNTADANGVCHYGSASGELVLTCLDSAWYVLSPTRLEF